MVNGRTQVRRHLRKRTALAVVLAALGLLLPASAAHAERFFTKAGAERVAKDFVSRHYADTYVEDLVAFCRPQGQRRHDPRYKYSSWVCGWCDERDDNCGTVLIRGRSGAGAYYGRVLRGARYQG